VWVLILVNLIVLVIVALILTKRMSARLPVCDQHEGYWRRRSFLFAIPTLMILTLGFAAIGYMATQPPQVQDDIGGWLCLGSIFALIAWVVVIGIVQANGVRATHITERTMTLAGLHRDFVDAVREDRAGDRDDDRYRRARYGDERDDYDDEFDEFPPRRRPRDDWDDEDDYDRRARRD
jgi:hypothetical protein